MNLLIWIPVCSALSDACQLALAGQRLHDGAGTVEKALTTHFELLNLVPDNSQKPFKSFYNQKQFDDGAESEAGAGAAYQSNGADENPTKWRRVGLVSGRNVHLDTIVWPGGDIVVSGAAACNILVDYLIEINNNLFLTQVCRLGHVPFSVSSPLWHRRL